MIKIKFMKTRENAREPRRMTAHAAGYDLFAANKENIKLEPGKLAMIPTGLAISLPQGLEAQIRPRSGLAYKQQIGILNSPGTIDADYRGEIKILLFNFGEAAFQVEPGMRIAQMIISRHEVADFLLCAELDTTERDAGGFGSTQD
ncbi:MAG: dUTP diphosphatase [Candidatus Cloacimonadales bacterium]